MPIVLTKSTPLPSSCECNLGDPPFIAVTLFLRYSRKKPEPLFVQFVAIVRSDGIQLTPVTGNLYEAKRRPNTSGRRNMERRQGGAGTLAAQP